MKNIKQNYIVSLITFTVTMHLQSSVHGRSAFTQVQHPVQPFSGLHSHVTNCLITLDASGSFVHNGLAINSMYSTPFFQLW